MTTTTDREGLRINLPPLEGLTLGQELKLRRLCAAYSVPFDPDHYKPAFDLPTGYVCGWIGGPFGHLDRACSTLYVGVSPEGEASS